LVWNVRPSETPRVRAQIEGFLVLRILLYLGSHLLLGLLMSEAHLPELKEGALHDIQGQVVASATCLAQARVLNQKLLGQ
jgi:hypothetical protein